MPNSSSGRTVLGVESPSDQDLVKTCLAGDQAAWNSIIRRYRNLVYSVPIRYGLSPDDAADVFQAVWLELYSQLHTLRNPEALGRWLLTVAARKSFQLRRESRIRDDAHEFELDQLTGPSLTAEWLEKTEKEQTFREVLDRLPARCRRLVSMLFYEDPPLSYADAAKKLGLAEGSIGFIRGRCLNKLRRELENSGF